MKQLLIVKKSLALNYNSATPADLSVLAPGAITFWQLDALTPLSAAATGNFAIALGRSNSPAFVIPEVDIDSLTITKALPLLGKAFKRKFTVPATVAKTDYTVILIKNGTVPHERNTWTFTHTATSTTASATATALKTAIEASLGDKFTVTVSTADVTITAKTVGEQWSCQLADGLSGVSFAGSTDKVDAEPTIGDKAYIQHLASMCAAGKGFTYTEQGGQDLIPGYPETVEDLVVNASGSNGASTEGYAVFTLRFRVGRDSAKTRDERVWQVVHIACPITAGSSGATYDSLCAILPEGRFKDNMMAATASATVTTMVKAASLNE